MNNQTAQQWADELREALSIEGENVPFDRALKRHLDGLTALRSRGLTWPSLANIFRRSGIQRPDGKPYSADHIRVSYDRLTKNTPPEADGPHSPIGRVRAEQPLQEATKAGDRRKPMPELRPHTTRPDSKDVSDDELALIAARLNKSNK